jgi:DNA-binding XRE family transcriptional regulator
MNFDLRKRTKGEELWLWRRDKGLTCAGAAEKLGVGRTTYWRMEVDRIDPPPQWKWVPVQEPKYVLLLALARRRAGLGLYKTARKYGVSHVILLQEERSGSRNLIAFWQGRGFRFPS